MEMPPKQTSTASSEIVKLMRKLRWVGLEEKAEQLENELVQQATTDGSSAVAPACSPGFLPGTGDATVSRPATKRI
jgi:hypothetical protein